MPIGSVYFWRAEPELIELKLPKKDTAKSIGYDYTSLLLVKTNTNRRLDTDPQLFGLSILIVYQGPYYLMVAVVTKQTL